MEFAGHLGLYVFRRITQGRVQLFRQLSPPLPTALRQTAVMACQHPSRQSSLEERGEKSLYTLRLATCRILLALKAVPRTAGLP